MDWSTFTTSDDVSGGWIAGDGDALAVLVHGGPGLSDYMSSAASEVRAALPNHRVARYQQRGLAPSTTGGPFTVAKLVEDLFDVVHHLGGERVLLVGHSWGGFLALAAACRHPDRITNLALLDSLGVVEDGGQGTMEGVISSRLSTAALAELAELPTRKDLAPEEAGARRMELIWPGYFADAALAGEPPAFRIAPNANEALMQDASRILADGSLARAVSDLEIPSVHVVGTASPIDPAVGRATARLSAAARLVELDCGHFPWLERPGSVTDAIRLLGAD